MMKAQAEEEKAFQGDKNTILMMSLIAFGYFGVAGVRTYQIIKKNVRGVLSGSRVF